MIHNAKGICPGCFEPVWREEESVSVGAKTYHIECFELLKQMEGDNVEKREVRKCSGT